MRWLACALFPGKLVAVDRLEGPFAVVELRLGVLVDVPLAMLPPGTGEGDRLLLARHRGRTALRACRAPGAPPRLVPLSSRGPRRAARPTRPRATLLQDHP